MSAERRALSKHEQKETCTLLSHAVCVQSTMLTSEVLLVPLQSSIKYSITFIGVIAVVRKVIPSPWD